MCKKALISFAFATTSTSQALIGLYQPLFTLFSDSIGYDLLAIDLRDQGGAFVRRGCTIRLRLFNATYIGLHALRMLRLYHIFVALGNQHVVLVLIEH